jgi:hypothetical protein
MIMEHCCGMVGCVLFRLVFAIATFNNEICAKRRGSTNQRFALHSESMAGQVNVSASSKITKHTDEGSLNVRILEKANQSQNVAVRKFETRRIP